MFKNTLLGVIAALAFSFSSIASANPAVFGNWSAVQQQNGFTLTMMASISATQTALGVKCEYQGQAVVVSGTVPSEVTASQILLKGSAKETKSVAGIECSIDVVPMTFDYSLNGDTLTLTAQGQSLPFTRVK